MVGTIPPSTGGTSSAAETTETAIRDRFVAFVAEKNRNNLDGETSWANSPEGPVKDTDAAAKINGEATGATVKDKGNTLWDANARHLKTNLQKIKIDDAQIVDYATLSDEQKVALDTYANISGTGTKDFVKAYKAAVDARSTDPLADAMKMVYERIARFSGKMAREIDAIDGEDNLRAGAAPAEGGSETGAVDRPSGLDAAQTALFDTAEVVMPLLQEHAALKLKLEHITQEIANPATTSARLAEVKTRLEALTGEISTNEAALAAQKGAVEGLASGTTISASNLELNADTLKADFAAATPLEADRAAQAALVDGAIATAKLREELAEPVSYNFPNIESTKAALVAAGKVSTNDSDERRTDYKIPESYIRGIYNPEWIDMRDGDTARVGKTLRKEIAAHKEEIAAKYLDYIKGLVLEQLDAAGYSNDQINANSAALESAIVSAAVNAKPVNAKGEPNKVGKGDDNKIADLTFDVSAGVNDFKAKVTAKTVETGTASADVEVTEFTVS